MRNDYKQIAPKNPKIGTLRVKMAYSSVFNRTHEDNLTVARFLSFKS